MFYSTSGDNLTRKTGLKQREFQWEEEKVERRDLLIFVLLAPGHYRGRVVRASIRRSWEEERFHLMAAASSTSISQSNSLSVALSLSASLPCVRLSVWFTRFHLVLHFQWGGRWIARWAILVRLSVNYNRSSSMLWWMADKTVGMSHSVSAFRGTYWARFGHLVLRVPKF